MCFPELNALAKIEHEDELFQRCDKYDDYLLFRLGRGMKKQVLPMKEV